MRFSKIMLGALALAGATPALAQDETDPPSDFTISGGATVVTDYRFRGFSQTSEEPTIQGTFSVSHASGFYLGVWGSGISFANGTEIDLYGGFTKEITPGLTGDIGATIYFYPGTINTTVVEPYVALTGTLGPATVKGMVAWAPSGQDSLADFSGIYLSGDVAVAIPSTPLKLKGHLGFANSDSFLGGLDGEVIDYSLGVEASYKNFTLGVSYVNTDETNFLGYKDAIGADGAVIVSLGAAF